jgi:hypothetical protein
MNFDDSFAKRRPVPILIRENCDQWFALIKRLLIGEELWYVIDHDDGSDTPTSGASSFSFGSQRIDAKAHYWLTICINADDQEYVADKTSAKQVWDALRSKYKEKLQTTGRQYLADFISYRMPTGTSIEEVWTRLTKLARQIAATQQDMSGLSKPECRFQALLQALPEEYTVIRDAIDAQERPDIKRGIQKLQEKEAQLNATETALWAKRGNERTDRGREKHKADRRRKSSSSSGSEHQSHHRRRSLKCFLCGGEHRLADCSHLPAAQKLVEERKDKKRIKQKSSDDLQTLAKLLKGKHKKHRAYNAEDEATEPSDSETDDEDCEEIAALSKEVASKVPSPIGLQTPAPPHT